MLWLWITLGALFLLLLLLAGAGWYFFRLTTVRTKERREDEFFADDNPTWSPIRKKMMEAQAWMREKGERVEITSYDGLKLAGIYIPAETDRPKGTLIVFHGYRSLATVDFAPEVQFLHGLGYRLLVPYQRSHGESEGRYICYGVRERYDARDWARYAADRFGEEDIFLAGISMGSATVTMAAGLELPGNVRGILADCGFTTPWDIMQYLAEHNYHLPHWLTVLLLRVVDLYTRGLAGYALKGADSRKALAGTQLPVLFVHGEADDFVPVFMTEENYRACGSEKELYLVKGAGHAQSFAFDPEGCEEKMAAFLERYCTAE